MNIGMREPVNETAYNTDDLIAIVKAGYAVFGGQEVEPERVYFRYYIPGKAAKEEAKTCFKGSALVKTKRYSKSALAKDRSAVGIEYSKEFHPLGSCIGARGSYSSQEGKGKGLHFFVVEPKPQRFYAESDLLVFTAFNRGDAPHALVQQIAYRAWCWAYHKNELDRYRVRSCDWRKIIPGAASMKKIDEAVAKLGLRFNSSLPSPEEIGGQKAMALKSEEIQEGRKLARMLKREVLSHEANAANYQRRAERSREKLALRETELIDLICKANAHARHLRGEE